MMPSISFRGKPPSVKISLTFLLTSNVRRMSCSRRALIPRLGGRFCQSLRQPRSYSNFRPDGCSINTDQVPALTRSKPLTGGFHIWSQAMPTSHRVLSITLTLTLESDDGALSGGGGFAVVMLDVYIWCVAVGMGPRCVQCAAQLRMSV